MMLRHISFELSQKFDQFLLKDCAYEIGELVEISACAIARVLIEENIIGKGNKVTVICGNGNNGADGLRVASHLCSLGYRISIFAPNELQSDLNRRLLSQCRMLGASIDEAYDESSDLVIDAVFGFGYRRRDAVPAILNQLKSIAESTPVISIDVPSGAEDGNEMAPWHPHMVCSLGLPKTCLNHFQGRHYLCSPILSTLIRSFLKQDIDVDFKGRLYVEITKD
jgi:hydroxyethylthiazole kinase-like uncharacterized protein yjeF